MKPETTSRLNGWLMHLAVVLLFLHFMTLFTVLMLRVFQLDDALFVQSLDSIGGFFKDTSFAAFLFQLIRFNFPTEALKAMKTMGRNRMGGGMYGGGGYRDYDSGWDSEIDEDDDDGGPDRYGRGISTGP